jgi:hypothetical protein
MKVDDYLLKLEENLMVGSGRWVADFNESFRDYPLGGFVFDMYVSAKVRPKGFFLSKAAAWLTTPNYYVACFAYSADPELKRPQELLATLSRFLQAEEFAWAWLIIPHEGPFSGRARALVERNDNREIGIALVDLAAEEIISSASHWGQKMTRFIKCFK